jgi:rfaE bifunctional protein nucleotidyltransferase chain/domain
LGKVMKDWEEALRFRESVRPGKVVFTNGVFDILHRGHVEYLAEARSLGQVLILGLNSDESAHRLKGPGRPIMKQEDRAVVLAALEAVSAVVIFNQDTPRELINYLKPDILVKGGDYRMEDIVGNREVRSWGGEVKVIPFRTGFSTTEFLKRVRELSG